MADERRDKGESEVERHNRRLGMRLFLVYLLVYVGFVGMMMVNYRWGGAQLMAGLNVAVVYGMGLIVGAMALSVIYTWLARTE